MNEPVYEVLWPLGRSMVEEIDAKPRIADLSKATIAHLSHYGFRHGEMIPVIEEVLTERYPGIRFIDPETFYRANPGLKPRLGRLIQTAADVTESSEQIAMPRGRIVLPPIFGNELDVQLSEQFMMSHRSDLEPVTEKGLEEDFEEGKDWRLYLNLSQIEPGTSLPQAIATIHKLIILSCKFQHPSDTMSCTRRLDMQV